MLMPGTVTTERGPQMLSLQLSPLLLLTLTPTLMRGTDTTDTMERGLLRLSQSLLLPLIPLLMLMPGTATTDTDTVATDGEATTGLTATTVTTERGLLRLNLQLSQLLLLTLTP